MLCVGGPVKYVAAPDSGVTKNWLLENVVPGIASFYEEQDNNIAEVLGLAVLWVCYDPEMMEKVPGWLLTRVRTSYQQIMEVQPERNPVEKRKLFVYANAIDGRLCIQDAATQGNIGVLPAVGGGVSHDNIQTQVFQMLCQINQQLTDLGGRLDNISGDMTMKQQQLEKKLAMVNKNIHRFIRQPAFPIPRGVYNNNIRNNNNDRNNNNHKSQQQQY